MLADEAVDISISEQMPLVLRFVDSSSQIREEFVGFVLCDTGTSGRALSDKILSTLQRFAHVTWSRIRWCGKHGRKVFWNCSTNSITISTGCLHTLCCTCP